MKGIQPESLQQPAKEVWEAISEMYQEFFLHKNEELYMELLDYQCKCIVHFPQLLGLVDPDKGCSMLLRGVLLAEPFLTRTDINVLERHVTCTINWIRQLPQAVLWGGYHCVLLDLVKPRQGARFMQTAFESLFELGLQKEVLQLRDHRGRTLLHRYTIYIELTGVSSDIIDKLEPNLQQADDNGDLVLHTVCHYMPNKATFSLEMVQRLYEGYPLAATQRSQLDRTPLHDLCRSLGCLSWTNIQPTVQFGSFLIHKYPRAAALFDGFGKMPYHYVANARGNFEASLPLLRDLLNAFPEAPRQPVDGRLLTPSVITKTYQKEILPRLAEERLINEKLTCLRKEIILLQLVAKRVNQRTGMALDIVDRVLRGWERSLTRQEVQLRELSRLVARQHDCRMATT